MKRFLFYLSVFFYTSVLFLSCVNESDEAPYDGYNWNVSTPENLGLNSSMINTTFNTAEENGFVYGIVIIRHGQIAAEKYFKGKSINSFQTIKSVSKSFLSALIGIAVDKGLIRLDQKLVDFFPEYVSEIKDERIKNVTLDQLIKMRAGFKSDEEFYFTFTESSDWVKTILSSALDFDPGSRMGYSTAGSHLMAAVLTKATGMNLNEFSEINLFEPMGIKIRMWRKDPQGYYFGGNDMYFTLRDMAVLGFLYLNKGKLNEKQIVPEDWVSKSIVSYSGTSTGSWGKLNKYGYGYFWWLGEVGGQKIFMGLGHGGQYVLCIPSLDMIIATESFPDTDWEQADIQERAVMDIIADYIIPAAIN
jgi:CubicO group peptidase (beta-lactamase class C family)